MKKIICLAGKMGAGKSYLLQKLSYSLPADQFSFSKFLKNMAIDNKIPLEREVLQEIGANFIENFKGDAFNNYINLNFEKEIILFDGLRHLKILKALQEEFTIILVYLDVCDEKRMQRVTIRDSISVAEFKKLSHHSTEQEVDILKNYAEFIINENTDIELFLKKLTYRCT